MNSANLPPGQQLAAASKWPVVGEHQPLQSSQPWHLEMGGLVRQTCDWSLEALRQLPSVTRTIDVHCVTRWSKLSMPFEGVPLAALLAAAEPLPAANFVSIVARSERQHSTSLPLRELLELDALVAWSHNGQPLTMEHGGPIRLVVPKKYFYKSVKWLTRIELLAADRLGYWEAEAGYHNGADPWREERYIAAGVSRADVARRVQTRDFAGLDLLSVDVSRRDLAGLNAAHSLLRNASFCECSLRDANFHRANLTNARLERADLRGASLREADLEGADFAGADLRGADLRQASLFGATFFRPPTLFAKFDVATRISAAALEQLLPDQVEFLQQAVAKLPGFRWE